MTDAMSLMSSVDTKISQIRTRTLDLSFNELLDMYANGELVIDPEYQRLFRWSEGSQSRFIESLVLEMPIPPIFVIEQGEGKYELIDGLQRISSYLHFRGQHPGCLDTNGQVDNLVLADCDIVKELNGLKYGQLPESLKIKLKRSFIRVEVIRKESDPRLRYYMFKRLNTGGEPLSQQEVRNCTIRLLSNDFNQFIIDMSSFSPFAMCVSSISDEKKGQKFDQELVLRFFAFKNWRANYVHDVGDFMTEYMEGVSSGATAFDYASEKVAFEKTFAVLAATLGEHAFSRVGVRGTIVSGFSSYHYEAMALGLQPYLDRLDAANGKQMTDLKHQFMAVKSDPEFQRITTGGGRNYANRLAERIDYVVRSLGGAV